MKANEFVKKFGIEKTSSELSLFQSRLVMWSDWEFVEELKRLVASHELVKSYGGIDASKKALMSEYRLISTPLTYKKLHDAIADVEACQ